MHEVNGSQDRNAEERESAFRQRLVDLHAVVNELSAATSMDDLCRKAVELGRARLGLDRLGIWISTDTPNEVRGTFGIAEDGSTRDERDQRRPIGGDAPMVRALARKGECFIERGCALRNQRFETVGHGDQAVVAMWDGRRTIGYVTMDNLLSREPITAADAEVVTLFATSVAHLYSAKRAEEAMQRSEQRFRELAELLPQTVFEIDTTGRLTFVNHYAHEMFGYSPEDFASGLNAIEMLSPECRDEARQRLGGVFRGEEQPGHEYMALRKDGSRFPVMIYSTRILQDGVCRGARGLIVDISRRRELEEELRQAQKMEAIGTLAGGIAHDFNNLLQGVLGYASLAMDELPADHPVSSSLAQIQKAGERAASLTRQLLAFSRREEVKLEVLRLNDVVIEMAKMLTRLIGEHIRLRIDVSHGLPPVYADRGHLEQVLLNLCVNARDAMPEGGDLRIRTQQATLAADDCAPWPGTAPGAYALLEVSDTGEGIPKDLQDRVFEPYFTTKEVGKGTGLGLATVYGIVKKHGGLIHVDSEPGRGATFRVYLPACQGALPDEEPAGDPPAVRGGSETVLLAEDDDIVRKLGAATLGRAGYRVILARDGEEALRLLRERGGEIRLAVLDLVMPGRSGADVEAAMRAEGLETPVVYCTGYSFDLLADSRRQTGSQVIRKPYQPAELLREVKAALGAP